MAKGDIAEINRFVGKTKVSKKYTKKKFYTNCYRNTEEGPPKFCLRESRKV